jgi:DNA polymerase-3 subunit epsilon
MRRFDKISQRLAKENMTHQELALRLETIEALEMCDVRDHDQLRLMGMPLVDTNGAYVTLSTRLTSAYEQHYCVVDIETTASDTSKGQIIEIGAVMLQGCQEVGHFESFVYAPEVPEPIQRLTGICSENLIGAPSLGSVLEQFRLFLKDAVFVAHNVGFDYYFISASLEAHGFGPMLNRKLCTIDLAQKTITAERYGLGHLRTFLGIDVGEHHRALSDAKSAAVIFCKALDNLPLDVCTAEDLIAYARPNPKTRKAKKLKNPPKEDGV